MVKSQTIIITKITASYSVVIPAQEKENNILIEAMEVDCPGVGDEDSSDTTDSDWGSDLENSETVLIAVLCYSQIHCLLQ